MPGAAALWEPSRICLLACGASRQQPLTALRGSLGGEGGADVACLTGPAGFLGPSVLDPGGLLPHSKMFPGPSLEMDICPRPCPPTGRRCRLGVCVFVCVCAQLLSHVPLFSDLMDCSPPGSSVHGTLQTRILEWVAMPSSRGIFPTQGSNLHLLHVSLKTCTIQPPPQLASLGVLSFFIVILLFLFCGHECLCNKKHPINKALNINKSS